MINQARNFLVMRSRLQTGFSMLEAVVVVGVLLALAVGGFLSYGPIAENAKKAAAKSAASQIYTAVMVALSDGDPTTNATDIVDKYNGSDTEYLAELSAPADDPSVGAMTTAAYTPASDSDFCLTITHKSRPNIVAQMGNCPAPESTTPTATPTPTPTATPTPTPAPTPAPAPADFNAASAPIVAAKFQPEYFNSEAVSSQTSNTIRYGFSVTGANSSNQGNYSVQFTGGENIGATVTQGVMNTYGEWTWYADVVPGAEGYKTGLGQTTAKVTNLTTNEVSYKTFTTTVNEANLAASYYRSEFWGNKTVSSNTSNAPRFGGTIQAANTSDFTVTFSGAGNVGVGPLNTATFNDAGIITWYTDVIPTAAGFTTGTGTITMTAVHNATGKTLVKTFTLTVTDAALAASYYRADYWNDKTDVVGITGAHRFGGTIQNASASDYTVVFSGDNKINGDISSTQMFNDAGILTWYTNVNPRSGGLTAGKETITMTATHNATGRVLTETFTLTIG